jgi:N-carbamoyl-L-amino-acid hydrolase
MVAKTLTAESTGEQRSAGLTDCTPEEFARLQQLNADYNARFGWPFILAVRGPRGRASPGRDHRHLRPPPVGHPDFERAECLRNIHRIAEIRLNDKFGAEPVLGNQVWDWPRPWPRTATRALPSAASSPSPTSPTPTAPAPPSCHWMRELRLRRGPPGRGGQRGGRYHGSDRRAPRLLTGSHYDTVRNGGKYDGRLGILVPLAACASCTARPAPALRHRGGGFAEEEGQRYKATFLGSGALVGHFDPPGWTRRTPTASPCARPCSRRPARTLDAIAGCAQRADYLGCRGAHRAGPGAQRAGPAAGRGHLDQRQRALPRPLHRHGQPCRHHADEPRRDAATAAAELALFAEARASADEARWPPWACWRCPTARSTWCPALRVQPGPARPHQRPARRHGAGRAPPRPSASPNAAVQLQLEEVMVAAAAPSDPAWQRAGSRGAGPGPARVPPAQRRRPRRDEAARALPQAMLFVRGGNAGISHNPLESVSNDDCELAVQALLHLLDHLAQETP